jgi:hypothetical protein
VDKEAGYRPDIFYVIAFIRVHTLQTWKISPRPKRAPPDWFVPCEGEYAMDFAILYEAFEHLLCLSTLYLIPNFAAFGAPPHAPAPSAGTIGTKQTLQCRP